MNHKTSVCIGIGTVGGGLTFTEMICVLLDGSRYNFSHFSEDLKRSNIFFLSFLTFKNSFQLFYIETLANNYSYNYSAGKGTSFFDI